MVLIKQDNNDYAESGQRPDIQKHDEMRYLVNFEHLIITLSGRFINLTSKSLDGEISHALETIGRFADVDRSYVFRFSSDGSRVSNTHEWCGDGIEPAIHRMQDAPVEHYAWAMSRYKNGEVLYIENVANLPQNAAYVKEELQCQDIQSLISVPLICAGKALGFVGFDSVRTRKVWGEEHIKLLKVVGEIIAGAIERERATTALTRRVRMEELVAHISTRFINIPTSRLECEINDTLRKIGEFTKVDRSYVFRLSEDRKTMDNTHEWCAPAIEPYINGLKDLPVDEFSYSMKWLKRGRIFHVPTVSELPSEAARERQEFESEGIKTLINVPIMTQGNMIGFLGFDAVHTYKLWSDDDKRVLKLVGEILASAMDRQAAEERLQSSLKEKEVLLREIHHRVKNNMQVVQSLLYLQANALREQIDPVALDAFEQSQGRIKSMAVVHDRLYRSKDLASIDFEDYLKVLIPSLIKSYRVAEQVNMEITTQNVRFGIDTAIPCGLIVNELVTNSLKHAFPNRRPGIIRVALRKIVGRRFELTVSDNGIGLPEDIDVFDGSTLGLQLVSDLVGQLAGYVEFARNQGTQFRITFKAPAA
jgi:two-component sensor histidine kinase